MLDVEFAVHFNPSRNFYFIVIISLKARPKGEREREEEITYMYLKYQVLKYLMPMTDSPLPFFFHFLVSLDLSLHTRKEKHDLRWFRYMDTTWTLRLVDSPGWGPPGDPDMRKGYTKIEIQSYDRTLGILARVYVFHSRMRRSHTTFCSRKMKSDWNRYISSAIKMLITKRGCKLHLPDTIVGNNLIIADI